MNERILAISDIHGCYEEMLELLQTVDYKPEKDQLILLGDYVDRGENSVDVLYYIKELVEHHGVVALKGNHDKMFCDWLEDPLGLLDRYSRNGGMETIRSFLNLPAAPSVDEVAALQEAAETIRMKHAGLIRFIEELPYYYETPDYVFVHAGINPVHGDWKETSEYEMIWIREPFLDSGHSFDQVFIHGHTPTIYLHKEAGIFFGEKKIGIDGGCVFGNQLNCLELKDGAYKQFSVRKKKLLPSSIRESS